ncbi:MAG: BA14K family protein [Devosiaceae bacterium]|nr:BA14K family protein [Devosiaceae bacterium MH13]
MIGGGLGAAITANQVRAYSGPQYYVYGNSHHTFGSGPVWDQHVAYCLGRYRSYNPNTNLFLAYSGVYRQCASPYIGG